MVRLLALGLAVGGVCSYSGPVLRHASWTPVDLWRKDLAASTRYAHVKRSPITVFEWKGGGRGG